MGVDHFCCSIYCSYNLKQNTYKRDNIGYFEICQLIVRIFSEKINLVLCLLT